VSFPEPTPRQVLYALVAAGFLIVVVVLTIGAATAGIVPGWWSAVLGVVLASAVIWMTMSWRRTGPMLLVGIGLFMVWLVGTLILAE